MNPPSHCLECNAPLSPSDAGGLCPKCLLRLGLVSQLASGTLPPTAAGLAPDGVVLEPFEFEGYRILRLLGKGGMGAVYEAEQHATGRRVALKVLGHMLDTPEMRQRFLREGQLAAAVRHPNSVAVFSAEEIQGAPVIAMELVPGGTLKDRVKESGPLPVQEAVDVILQIIDGLEAAHAGGVLHRDIKPANCFFGDDGVVKVGDFGLSISTLVKAEQQLTQTGTILGTPSFASPEQLRAQEIDVRSDIYSVSATLYYLLTGKAPHDADTLVGLIAAVLERDPVSPQELRPEIPVSLSRVIMRCLSRAAASRFATYRELRAALLPFGSGAARSAPLGRRFLAGLIDALVVSLPWTALLSITGINPETNLLMNRGPGAILGVLLIWLWELLSVSLPEARWGAGLGKAICGLRVIRLSGDTPGLARSLGRWAIISAAEYGAYGLVLLRYGAAEYRELWLRNDFVISDWLPVLLMLSLFVTMRRRNGFATVYDLLTGTRVVVAPAVPDALVPTSQADLPVFSGAKIGQYVTGARLNRNLIEAFDEALRRQVWIHEVPAGTPPLPPQRRDLGRPGRLRWLTGVRSESANWDAYEAPQGDPLTHFLDATRPWGVVRQWLFGIADELRAGLNDGTLPPEVSADRLWLAGSGQVVLLDFHAPGAPSLPFETLADESKAQRFLSFVARAALTKRVPLHARNFLRTLEEERFESMALIAGNLRADMNKPATVSFRQRLISIAVPLVITLLCAIATVFSESHNTRRFEEQWARAYPGLPSPRLLVAVHDESENPAVRGHCLTLLSGKYRATEDDDAFWAEPSLTRTNADEIRSAISKASEALPQVTPGEIAAAEAALQKPLEEQREKERFTPLLLPLGVGAFVLTLGAVFGTAWAALFGTPPLLRMNDLAIVLSDSRPASRFRVVIRALLAWTPLVAASLMLMFCFESSMSEWIVAAGVVLVSLFALAVLCVRHPDRAPHDYFTGTWLVPR